MTRPPSIPVSAELLGGKRVSRPPSPITQAALIDLRGNIGNAWIEFETPNPKGDYNRIRKAAHRRGWRWKLATDDRRVYVWMEK